ncbi:MAG: hypothetical protein KDJ88_00505 [Bauldia sp.]|nr:hypothetical protein [Bauldia sp.]
MMIAHAVAAALIFAASPAVAASACHPSYEPCIAVASDADCIPPPDQETWGNGPIYSGRVLVIGPDDYELDRDHNGIGCERSPPQEHNKPDCRKVTGCPR